jgi:hypothetical protein
MAVQIAVVVLVGLAASAAVAATYHVDGEQGDDAGDGLSPQSAWRTLDKVNATTFAPGDAILLKSDCSWQGQLWPKGSGEESGPIMIDAYGEGEKRE